MARWPKEPRPSRGSMARATLFMAVCWGLGVFFLTGDRGTGALVFLVVAGIAALPVWFSHARLAERRPPAFFYVMGVAAMIVPLAQLRLGLQWSPWADLEEQYRPQGTVVPDGFAGGSEVVLVAPSGQFTVRPYRFKRASTSFGSEGVLLRAAWPMSLVYDPLWIPVGSISACAPSGLDRLRTALRLARSPHSVEVVDPEGRVAEWCRQHDIGDGLPAEAQ